MAVAADDVPMTEASSGSDGLVSPASVTAVNRPIPSSTRAVDECPRDEAAAVDDDMRLAEGIGSGPAGLVEVRIEGCLRVIKTKRRDATIAVRLEEPTGDERIRDLAGRLLMPVGQHADGLVDLARAVQQREQRTDHDLRRRSRHGDLPDAALEYDALVVDGDHVQPA